jgi:hypothetical protein
VLERREAQQTPAPAVFTPTPPAEPSPAALAPAPTVAAPASREEATPAPREAPGADPEHILTLFSAGDFAGAEAAVESFRRARPGAREADLLETLILGTRYVLEGSAEPALLARARKAFLSWRKRGGSRRSEEALISPSLLATLNGT